MLRRFRSLPIRSRLAMLVAAAVAFAVAAVSVTCWFIVQGKLYDQVNADLEEMARRPGTVNALLQRCTQTPQESTQLFPGRNDYVQAIKEEGAPCVDPNSPGTVNVTSADKEVIKGANRSQGFFRNGTDEDGNAVRVLTVYLGVDQNDSQGVAVQLAAPLKSTQSTLNELALILLLVSGIGVIGAGAAGLAVARAGLRPVDKLTEAVEHVARTEDLNVRIPVEDDAEDEVARLSRSFNSMTSALASSHELQQQLIADAGHELRTPSPPCAPTSSCSPAARRRAARSPRRTARHCSPR